jgi:DNA replication initiation complex subunit (GINS family)
MSPVDELRTKQSTMQMIDSCEAGLKGLNRNLTDEEKTILSNIRNFITQSRAALADGEVELAHNYASKAHQLCDELLKH